MCDVQQFQQRGMAKLEPEAATLKACLCLILPRPTCLSNMLVRLV